MQEAIKFQEFSDKKRTEIHDTPGSCLNDGPVTAGAQNDVPLNVINQRSSAGNSAAEPGKFFVRGKAALRRQLVDEAWYKLRQLRGHFLFGQTRLFSQGLNN